MKTLYREFLGRGRHRDRHKTTISLVERAKINLAARAARILAHIMEFKKRRRLRQRQRQKAVILLVKRTKMIVLHVRHAFLNISLPYSSKLLREMTNFKVLTTTWTNYSESFSLTLYFKSVRTNPVIGHFAPIE